MTRFYRQRKEDKTCLQNHIFCSTFETTTSSKTRLKQWCLTMTFHKKERFEVINMIYFINLAKYGMPATCVWWRIIISPVFIRKTWPGRENFMFAVLSGWKLRAVCLARTPDTAIVLRLQRLADRKSHFILETWYQDHVWSIQKILTPTDDICGYFCEEMRRYAK